MTQFDSLSRFDTELGRVVHRLQVLPDRLRDSAYELTWPVIQELRNLTVAIDPVGPRNVPRLSSRTAADQLIVVARDLSELCDDDTWDSAQWDSAADLLASLRRTLP